MKKLIFTLSLFIGFSVAANAQAFPNQYCTPGSGPTVCTPKAPTGIPGLSPVSDSLPLVKRWTPVNTTIYFENYDSAQGFKINSLKIDTIGNLPEGLCWKTNTASNTFNNKQVGCINVTGTTNAAPGQYKLYIAVTAQTTFPLHTSAEAIGLRYYVRVVCAEDAALHPIDTVLGKTQFFVPYSPACVIGVGISEAASDIKLLSVVPNPFSNTAQVSFFAENEANYTARLTNVIGSEVYRKEIAVEAGSNKITLDRGTLNAGVYFFSLSNAKGSITKRVVVE